MYIFVFPTGIDIIFENKVLNYKISVCVLFAMCILQHQCVCAVCHVYTTKSVCVCVLFAMCILQNQCVCAVCHVYTTQSVCMCCLPCVYYKISVYALFAMCILQTQCVCCLPCVYYKISVYAVCHVCLVQENMNMDCFSVYESLSPNFLIPVSLYLEILSIWYLFVWMLFNEGAS